METVWTNLVFYIVTFGAIIFGGLWVDIKNGKERRLLLEAKKKDMRVAASQFNIQVNKLEKLYKQEKRDRKRQQNAIQKLVGWDEKYLRKEYQNRYDTEKKLFLRKAQEIVRTWESEGHIDRRWTWFWRAVIVAGVITLLGACSHALITIDTQEAASEASLKAFLRGDHAWNAKDIPMPHLTDGSRYVTNPDSIITEETVARLDAKLKQLDDSLGIESVVAIVGRVENADIFKFSQDIFDIYKVGKNDRGMVMVLAYDDHLFRTHTGRALEPDLTDAECFRLQERYLIPSMKAELPDSGMIYLVEAVYNTLKGKELPVMSELHAKSQNDEDDEIFLVLSICFFLMAGWIGLYLFLAHRHGWNLMIYGRNLLFASPFIAQSTGGSGGFFVGSGGGGGGFGGGGGGFSGGFGGGSSGGGGATSSW